MITDKQGREWLLQKLYDDGWRYIVGSADDYVFITKSEPNVVNGLFRSVGIWEIYKHIELKSVLPSLERGEVMNIAEELGIVDWSKVKVDTPVLVRDFENQDWKKRYFAFFDDELIYTWDCGATSWSVKNKDAIPWKYAKLAEV
jgi:hypothetical protein|nr:MAG TPA: hypothetical protein [Caudoviricetes sp.]